MSMYQQAPNNFGFGVNPAYPLNGGMVPNQQQPPRPTSWLSPEQVALLQKNNTSFNLGVSDEDIARGQCNHYYPSNGQSALIPDADGSGGCTCAICGSHFTTKEYSQTDVEAATHDILDILNTIKITYLSLDPHAANDYFQIIPFIEKIPKLYTMAMNDFKKYEGIDSYIPSGNVNPFTVFGMMTNPGMGFGTVGQVPYGTQPMYQQTAPMGGQAPMGNVNVGYAQANPAMNPMYGQYQAPVYNGPQVNTYQPQSQGYAMNPQGAAAPQQNQQGYFNSNMPVQPQAPQQAPVQTAPATTENEVKVDTQFKK